HQVKTFCKKVPKGGMLHVHPYGTLNRETVNRLLYQANPPLQTHKIVTEILAQEDNAMLYPKEIFWLSQLKPNAHFLDLSLQSQNHFQDFFFLPPGKQPFSRFNAVF